MAAVGKIELDNFRERSSMGKRGSAKQGRSLLIHVNHFVRLLPHRRMLPNFQRLLIDAHRPEVNRSHLTIGPTAFG